ncbi:MAG: alpha-hydroxy acid oxidase [Gammaproteobacteria bacterium]
MPTTKSTMKRLNHCHNIADLRAVARKRLPRAIFDYIDGGAEDEVSLRANMHDFNRWQLVPEILTDVEQINLATRVLGEAVSMPLVLSPTGMTRTFHPLGERAVAPAAADAGIIYSLSSMSSVSIEEIGALTNAPKWFQIYVWRDRGIVRDFIARARSAGFKALCLTVDVQIAGNRERDLYNGLTVPPKLNAKMLLDMMRYPGWCFNMLRHEPLQAANVVGKAAQVGEGVSTVLAYVSAQFDRSVTWADAEWMIQEWNGPFAIKGILSVQDALRAVEAGATGIIVSNHGGRQLDSVPSPIELLPEIVEAVGDRAEVIIDGGVRRGTDIIKALALGATACMAGRPYLYGLAAGGQAGVERALSLLQEELRRDMILLGVSDIAQLNRSHLRALHGATG